MLKEKEALSERERERETVKRKQKLEEDGLN